jgi:hypothetical protein
MLCLLPGLIFFVPATIYAPFHALVCSQVLFSFDDITTPFLHAITNLLQEFKDIFLAEVPPGLPPLRGIEHQIDLNPGETLTNRAAYGTNPEETKEIQRQIPGRERLSPCVILVILIPRKMVLGTFVLIVESLTILPFAIIFLYQG